MKLSIDWNSPLVVSAWAMALLWGVFAYTAFTDTATFYSMLDPDSMLRLHVISNLYHDGGWYDHLIARLDPPLGMVTPWTRPVDILVLALSAPWLPFMSFDSALLLGQLTYNPVIVWVLLRFMYLSLYRFHPLPGLMWCLFPAIVLVPSTSVYFGVGGVDHHSLLAMLAVALWYYGACIGEETTRCRAAYFAGFCIGLGIWVSVEFMVASVIFIAWLMTLWCLRGEEGWMKSAEAALKTAFSVLALGMLVEKRPDEWLHVEYDTLSVVYLLTFAVGTVCVVALRCLRPRLTRPSLRWTASLLVGGGAAIALWVAFPGIVLGPMAAASPTMIAIMDDYVEMQPLWGTRRGVFLSVYFLASLGILARYRRTIPKPPYFWLLLLATTGFFVATMCMARNIYYFMPVSMMLFLWLAGQKRDVPVIGRVLLRSETLLILAFVPTFLGLAAKTVTLALTPTPSVHNDMRGSCVSEQMRFITSGEMAEILGERPLLVGIDPSLGPAVLFRTHYSIISGFYHRDEGGLTDLLTLMKWDDATQAKEILHRRHVDILAVCAKNPANLYIEQHSPAWAQPVARKGKEDAGLKIYRVLNDRLAE